MVLTYVSKPTSALCRCDVQGAPAPYIPALNQKLTQGRLNDCRKGRGNFLIAHIVLNRFRKIVGNGDSCTLHNFTAVS